MKRPLQVVGVWLVASVVALSAQTAKEPAAPRGDLKARPAPKPSAPKNPAPKNPAAKNPVRKNPEAPKGRGGQRLGAPGNPVERLMAMPPEKREQVLERLPPQQQANLRQRLDRFDKLPAAERARLNQLWSTFNALPPEKQETVKRQMEAFNNLPEERQKELKPVLQRLRVMPEDRRSTLLNSPAFKNRFSPAELQMLTDISQNYPLPGR